MQLRLGIDIACRAAHQASLADERGEFLWSGTPVPHHGRPTSSGCGRCCHRGPTRPT